MYLLLIASQGISTVNGKDMVNNNNKLVVLYTCYYLDIMPEVVKMVGHKLV